MLLGHHRSTQLVFLKILNTGKFNLLFQGIGDLNSRNLSVQFYRYKKRQHLKFFFDQQKHFFSHKGGVFHVSFFQTGISASIIDYAKNNDYSILSFPNGEKLTLSDYLNNKKEAFVE